VYIGITMLQDGPVMCIFILLCYRTVQLCVYWFNFVTGRSSYVYIGLTVTGRSSYVYIGLTVTGRSSYVYIGITMLQGGPVMCILV
jgi:hypothetical protein